MRNDEAYLISIQKSFYWRYFTVHIMPWLNQVARYQTTKFQFSVKNQATSITGNVEAGLSLEKVTNITVIYSSMIDLQTTVHS